MYKNKFESILQKDEEIKWASRSNALTSCLKSLIPTILFEAFISFAITMFVSTIFFRDKMMDGPYLKPFLYILPVMVLITMLMTFMGSLNTYFAITNKRIIKRSGVLKNTYIHYSLKNVGNIEAIGSIFGKNSVSLRIIIKEFHNDSNALPSGLLVNSLYNGYEGYKILSEIVEGNNESVRVKIEK